MIDAQSVGVAIAAGVALAGAAWAIRTGQATNAERLAGEIAQLRQEIKSQNGRVNRMEAWQQQQERYIHDFYTAPPWAAPLASLTDSVGMLREDVAALRQQLRDAKDASR